MHCDLAQLVRGSWDCRRFVCQIVGTKYNISSYSCFFSGMYYFPLPLSNVLVHVLVSEKTRDGCDGCTCLQTKGSGCFLGYSPTSNHPCVTPKRIIPPTWGALSSPHEADLDLEGALLLFPAFPGKLWKWFSSFSCDPGKKGYFFLWQKNLWSLLVILGVTCLSISIVH